MSVLLPAFPGIAVAKPRLIDFGATLTPPMGGPAQRLNRIGNRFGIDVTYPSSRSDQEGRILVARLVQAMTEGAVLAFPQDMAVGSPGAPVVDGAGQTGQSLNIKSGTPNYAYREGQWLSIIHGGRRYLHFVTAQAILSNTGAGTLPIYPMLRISPADVDVVEVAKPMIEGFVTGNALEWQIQTAPFVDVSFTLAEAA